MSPTPTIDVACLCAAWCRLCDSYRPAFEQAQAEFERDGLSVRWHWIDIEDESELVDDFDVETFPTIVVVDSAAVRFAGPLTPQPDTLRRVLRSALADVGPDQPWPTVTTAIADFAQRLRQRQVDGSHPGPNG
jgi:thiol-disulfide isomerase/thioredoxin